MGNKIDTSYTDKITIILHIFSNKENPSWELLYNDLGYIINEFNIPINNTKNTIIGYSGFTIMQSNLVLYNINAFDDIDLEDYLLSTMPIELSSKHNIIIKYIEDQLYR